MVSVAYPPAIDKHSEMPPQCPLVIKDIAAQSRLHGEDGLECFPERARFDLTLGRCNMSLNRSSEEDVHHGGGAAREWPRALVL